MDGDHFDVQLSMIIAQSLHEAPRNDPARGEDITDLPVYRLSPQVILMANQDESGQ